MKAMVLTAPGELGLEDVPRPATPAGDVLVQNKPVAAPGADRGMVFQDYTSFDNRTVLDNIVFGLECQGIRRRDRYELGRRWISQVGLNIDADAEKYPHELSGGMRQRVAIARTLILRPRIILMDEPFGALDPTTRMNMQDLLVGLWREVQATVFFVTHSIEEAVFLGTRVVVLASDPGRVAAEARIPLAEDRDLATKRTPAFLGLRASIEDMVRAQHRCGVTR